MVTLWAEVEILASMYAATARHFAWAFLAAVLIAAVLTTYRFDTRIVPFFERTGLWGHAGAILLGLVSPF